MQLWTKPIKNQSLFLELEMICLNQSLVRIHS